MDCNGSVFIISFEASERPAVSCSDWLGCEGGIIHGVKTAFVPNARDAIQLVKLIPTMIIADAHDRCGAISKCELLGLKRVVILPLPEKLFQFSLISDPDTRPNWEISLIWSVRLAHGFSTLTRKR